MKKAIFAGLISLLFAACSGSKTESKETDAAKDSTQVAGAIYQCPMDCENGKTYDKPGQCPVCGMDLEIKS